MTECVSCGSTLGADARFCPSCGAAVPAPDSAGGAPVGSPVCPVCAAVLPPDARFCGECGTPLAAPVSQIPGSPSAPPTYQGSAAVAYTAGPRQPGPDFFSRFDPLDWVIVGAALLAFVGAFLPRYTWASEGYSQSQNAWDSTWAGLAVVLCIVAGLIVVIKVVDAKTPISGAVVMICGGIATLFMLLEFVRRPSGDYASPSFGVGIFLCTAAAIAVAVAGYLRWQKERAAVPLTASGAGTWAASAPPSAQPAYAPLPLQQPSQPFVAPAAFPAPSVVPVLASSLSPSDAAAPAAASSPSLAPAAASSPDHASPIVPTADPASPDEVTITVSAPEWEPPAVASEMPQATASDEAAAITFVLAAPSALATQPPPGDQTASPSEPSDSSDDATLVLPEPSAPAATELGVSDPEPFRPVFCGNCGERLSGRPFCKSCGQRVDA